MSSSREEIPAALLNFIHRAFDSVEQLQVLLLLVECPEKGWLPEELSSELRSSTSSIQKRLKDLITKEVLATSSISAEGRAHYVPFSEEVDARVKDLSELYLQRPHRVIAQLYSKPPLSLESFSDSFKFKKDNS